MVKSQPCAALIVQGLGGIVGAQRKVPQPQSKPSTANPIHFAGMQGVDGERVQYIPFDFHFHSKQRGAQVLAEIAPTVQAVLAQTGIFACPPALPSPDAHRLAAATWVGGPML